MGGEVGKGQRLHLCFDNVIRELLRSDIVGEGESLLTKVGTEDKVSATLVSTVSSHKGKSEEMLDGFLLAVVKES